MKRFAVVCAVLLATCLFSRVEGKCEMTDGPRECARYTCHDDGSISAVGCPAYRCSVTKRQIGYRDVDLSKPYPECCGGPICQK